MKLPKQNINSELGEQGLTIVKQIVEKELHWIFRKNHQEHDYGIDAYIDLTTDLRQVTGKSIALQVKTGESYFTEKNTFGWVYRDQIEHLNYYLNHQIPVFILLVNEKENKVYWCLCEFDKTEQAGENWKITIPFNQVLNGDSRAQFEKYVSPLIDYVSPLQNFWEQNKLLKNFGRIFFIVDKQSVIDKKYHELIMAIERLKVNPDLMETLKGKVDIGIHGYDQDERELYEIKEVREWVDLLFKNVNGLTYFLATDEFAQFLRIIQFCKVGVTIKGVFMINGKKKKRVEINFSNSQPFMEEMFLDLNTFAEKHNISLEVNKDISFRLYEYLTRGFMF
jgi:hypothetical protein